MIENLQILKLYFFLSSDLPTDEKEEEAARYFDNERRRLLDEIIGGLNERHIGPFSPKTFNFKNWAQKYIECPVMLPPAFEPRAKKELATLAQLRLSNLIEVLDMEEAELLSLGEEIEPKTKTFLAKRISRLLATLAVWENNLKNGEFEVFQTRPHEKMPEHFERFPQLITHYNPNNTGRFPAIKFNVPWNPAAAKVKKEPEEFRNNRLIWNGAKNALAYIFYQLKYEHSEGQKPMLDASNEDLALFLKANFEVFKEDKITSIMALIENREKHPQKGKNQFLITKGTPPKD